MRRLRRCSRNAPRADAAAVLAHISGFPLEEVLMPLGSGLALGILFPLAAIVARMCRRVHR